MSKARKRVNDDASKCTQTGETPAQRCLSKHMQRIVDLPINSRLALERDIINLLITEELSAKKNNYNAELEKAINDETEEFLRDISYKKVLDIAHTVECDASGFAGSVFSNTSNNCQKGITPSKHNSSNIDNSHKIKRCRVRVKRINMEDHVPLSNVKNL